MSADAAHRATAQVDRIIPSAHYAIEGSFPSCTCLDVMLKSGHGTTCHGRKTPPSDFCQSSRLEPCPNLPKLTQAVQDFTRYIQANQAFIPNYGDRYRYGEKIATGFVESAVNQV